MNQTLHSYQTLLAKLEAYDVSQYQWRPWLSHEENCGVFVNDRVEQEIGYYSEMRLVEYNPDGGAKHLPVGGRVDWVDTFHCAEQKQKTSSDNGSSKKQNIKKLVEYAEEHTLTPLYCYVQDRPKNDYVKDGVRHLHGSAIFAYFGCPDKWDSFNNDLDEVRIIIGQYMRNRFNEHYGKSA